MWTCGVAVLKKGKKKDCMASFSSAKVTEVVKYCHLLDIFLHRSLVDFAGLVLCMMN